MLKVWSYSLSKVVTESVFEKVEKGEKNPCLDLGSREPAAIRLTLECLQESARQSGCFLIVNFMYVCVSNQKQPSCKKKVWPPKKGHSEKRCEIQAGGQELFVMVG